MSYRRKYLILFTVFLALIQFQLVQAETQKLVQSNNSILGKYIVILKEESSRETIEVVRSEAQAIFNASVENTYTHVLKGFSAIFEEQQAIALSNDPRVKMVVEDTIVSIPGNTRRKRKRRKKRGKKEAATWGLDRLDQAFLPLNKKYRRIGNGKNVNVYVVDTGIRLTHQEFEGRASFGVNMTSIPFEDCNSHGTHVAGTIGGKTYGVAKKVNLISVKVLGIIDRSGICRGVGSLSWAVAGLDWIAQNAQYPAVVNMSLGAEVETTVLDMAVKNLISKGITVVIAAGNENKSVEVMTPARVREAIIVGATNDKDEKPIFSNWGSGVDVFAPGVFVKSAWFTADDDVREASGTSMAAPHVAGFAALLLQKNPTLTPARIESIIKDHSMKGIVKGLESLPETPNRLLAIRQVPMDLSDFVKLDPYFYLQMHPDVDVAVGSIQNYAGGANHWEKWGVNQGRMSSPAHMPNYYFFRYPELANAFGANAWAAAHSHWYNTGRSEGRSGSPAFDPHFYFATYPDLTAAFGSTNFGAATQHWIERGIDEGRAGSPAFDPFYYLAAHPDVRSVVGEGNYRKAILHWFKYGINEGRRASWFFDPVFYLQANPDVAAAFGSSNYLMGLFHYMTWGRTEGRRAIP